MILAGDIGGTKTVLAMCEGQGAGVTIVREQTFRSAEFASLDAIVDQFVTAEDRGALTAASFGVAGPVVGGSAKITNLPWTIASKALASQLGGIPVGLLNDLQSTALGMLVLPTSAFEVLQDGVQPGPNDANDAGDRPSIAVIAPGTGLGEALLIADGADYRPLPSEGGHADFAPGTDDEIALLHYLRGRHGEHVSYERVLSGAGIADLYGFVRGQSGSDEPAWLTEKLKGHDRNAVISQAALDGSDAACVRALEMFVEILGAEAGNLALRGVATGGVVIGGGIPPKILPALKTGSFLARFNAKGRFATWTRQIRVRVALEPRASLLGAAHHAATHAATHAAHHAATHKDTRS